MIVDLSPVRKNIVPKVSMPPRTFQTPAQAKELDRLRSSISEHIRRSNELNVKLSAAMDALEAANMEIARLSKALEKAQAELAKQSKVLEKSDKYEKKFKKKAKEELPDAPEANS